MRVPGHLRESYTWRWTAALAGLAVLAIAVVVALVMRPAERVQAATFTVNSLADTADIQDTVAPFGALNGAEAADGICDVDPTATTTCTLRAAIFEANANGDTPDTITISVTGTITLTLGTPLPLGETTAANAPADGTSIDAGTLGNLVLTCGGAFNGFQVTGASNTIRDFVINGCTGGGNAVRITTDNADSNTITSNRIGTNALGTVAAANGNGVVIDTSADSNTISNNLISGNSGSGVKIDGAGTLNNVISGNYIGTDAGGTAALPNNMGIEDMTTSPTTIGGTTVAARNIISGNTIDGIRIGGDSATVQGNCIGTTQDCVTPRPNGDDGVEINIGSSNLIGGTAAGAGNVIQFNVDDGVAITGAGSFNRVTHNTIVLNGGMGIMCGTIAADCDAGSNEGVTTPVIGGCADAGSGNVSCTGTVPGAFAIAGVTVDVYLANVDGSGPEGQRFLCTTTTGAVGAWGCTFANPGGGTATATATTAGLSTSEFSDPAGIPPGVVPTNTPVATNTPAATDTPTPTASNTATPTRTGTPPTSTPTPTRTGTPATSTPTPTRSPTATPTTTGTTQTVTLIGGICNPLASTYADGTPIATISGAVSPSGILISIWWFDTATIRWLGYDPLNPANPPSDLTLVDRLDAIFICVSTAGDWSRPVI